MTQDEIISKVKDEMNKDGVIVVDSQPDVPRRTDTIKQSAFALLAMEAVRLGVLESVLPKPRPATFQSNEDGERQLKAAEAKRERKRLRNLAAQPTDRKETL